MTESTTLTVATAADEPFLWEMLAEAAHLTADGDTSVLAAQEHPFLAKFVRGWGRPGDIAAWPPEDLTRRFGRHGEDLARHAQGVDDRPIVTERAAK